MAVYSADVDKDSTLVALHKFSEVRLKDPPELLTDKCITDLAYAHPTELFLVIANLHGKQDVDVQCIAKALQVFERAMPGRLPY